MLLKTPAAFMFSFLAGPQTSEFNTENSVKGRMNKGQHPVEYCTSCAGHAQYPAVKISRKFSEIV
jgi:hypothetical protein